MQPIDRRICEDDEHDWYRYGSEDWINFYRCRICGMEVEQ